MHAVSESGAATTNAATAAFRRREAGTSGLKTSSPFGAAKVRMQRSSVVGLSSIARASDSVMLERSCTYFLQSPQNRLEASRRVMLAQSTWQGLEIWTSRACITMGRTTGRTPDGLHRRATRAVERAIGRPAQAPIVR